MTVTEILLATSSTEECTFNEFLRGLPEKVDDWRELFQQLEHLESIGLVTIDRGYNNRIDALQLTEHGVNEVKEALRNGKAR